MKKADELVLSSEARLQMEALIANAVFVYLHAFSRRLFPEYTTSQSLDIVMSSVAQAICRFEGKAGKPCALTLAHYLLDQAEETKA